MRPSEIIRRNLREPPEPSLLQQVAEVLAVKVGDLQPRSVSAGAEASVFAFNVGPTAVVWKQFGKTSASGSAEVEYGALSAAWACGLRVPRPIALLRGTPPGYIMAEVVRAKPVDTERTSRLQERSREILSALRAYHCCVGAAYEDFQPANVLVNQEGVWFIDPSHEGMRRDRYLKGLDHVDPVVHDVSYWLMVALMSSLRLVLVSPARGLRRLLLSKRMLSELPYQQRQAVLSLLPALISWARPDKELSSGPVRLWASFWRQVFLVGDAGRMRNGV
jgi:hypothetical protein